MRKSSTKTNAVFVVGLSAFIDISTKAYPNAWAVVDKKDIPLVIDGMGRWSPSKSDKSLYVCRRIRYIGKRQYMHRLLAADSRHKYVDHHDCDTFNNRRLNLRPCTQSQNSGNQKGRGPLGLKGVTLRRYRKSFRFEARICRNNKRIHIGYFKSKIQAAKAYDVKARQLFGQFALTNFKAA